MLCCYGDAGSDARIFDELGDLLRDGEVEAADAGALLLGRDMAKIHGREPLLGVGKILREAEDPYSRLVTDILKSVRPRHGDEDDAERARICKKIAAFGRGLGLRPG